MLTPIGQTLKAAREARGLSLPDVAHLTRIPVSRLTMLEQDNYAAFGGMTYARLFLRHYSQYLGVDASVILEDLPSGVLGGPRDYRYLLENHGDWVPPKSARRASSSRPNSKVRARRSPVPAGLFVFMLVLAGTGMWGKYVADDRLAAEEAAKSAPALPAEVSPTKPLSASVQVPQVKAEQQPPVKILKAIPVPEDESGQGSAGNSSRVE